MLWEKWKKCPSAFSIFLKKTSLRLTGESFLSTLAAYAEVVELVDTLASGASGGNPVEVRVLFSVPLSDLNPHNLFAGDVFVTSLENSALSSQIV